jgi:hypothetical protein
MNFFARSQLIKKRDSKTRRARLARLGEKSGGCWYREADTGNKGWLYPSLFKYFEKAPGKIYVKAERLLTKIH